MDGWENAKNIKPNPPTDPSWNYDRSSSGCTCRETRQVSIGCAPNQKGQKYSIDQRFYTSRAIGSGSWGEWSVFRTIDKCSDRNEGGSCRDENGVLCIESL